MTKKEMALRLSKDVGITTRQAEKALNSFLEGIKTSLKRGERVTFSGFGSFEIKKAKARTGKNPKTGADIKIPPKKRIKFNPSKQLKDAV